MENQEPSTSRGADLSFKNHYNGRRELVDLTGSVYSTIPSGFKQVLIFLSEGLPGKDREDVTVIDKDDGTSTQNGVVVIGTETWEPFTWYSRHKHETFTLILRPAETTSSGIDLLSLTSHLTLPGAAPTTSSEELTSSLSTSESLSIPTAEPSQDSLSAVGWAFILVTAVFVLVLSTMVTFFILLRSRSRDNQNNLDIPLDNAPFEHPYTEHLKMPVPLLDSDYIDKAQSQSPDLETTENEEFEHEHTSYIQNEPRIFIDSLGHTYSDMESSQEPYSTYAKVITIPHKKIQEPATFTSKRTITLTSMATLTSFTTIFETRHLGPVDPLPKVPSKITTHITITAVKDHSTSSHWTSRPAVDLNTPSSHPRVDESTGPSLWSTVTISDRIPSSSTLAASNTVGQDEPDLPTATEASSSSGSLTTGAVVGIALGVWFIIVAICSSVYLCLRIRRKRKGASPRKCVPRGVETSPSSPTPSNWPYGQELNPILAPHRSTEVRVLLTTDARHMSFDIDENGYNMGLKYYKGEASGWRNPDGYNTDLGQDPGSKGKERAE
ncbi:hypothetical protein FGADI_10372 [Fusarium gaditjirri]|uniref:Uncharacterized protein n=1 Tax=Fusarium gaditjirri TaxID=282569 RepID=A0A8H4WRP0_9HYPO|nr:hypothetical protein FGADI_10372 [Fusarium gaditjirri]